MYIIIARSKRQRTEGSSTEQCTQLIIDLEYCNVVSYLVIQKELSQSSPSPVRRSEFLSCEMLTANVYKRWHCCCHCLFLCVVGPNAIDISELNGAESCLITASLSGGEGDTAWQHAQLFRSSSNEPLVCSLEIIVSLKQKE